MKRTAVYIATTEGPSEVQRITPEDCDVRSVICHDGKAIALPISQDYDSFVRRPTGVIEACFGHSAFRVDIAHPIASGLSWQLGLFTAHALYDEGALVRSDDKTPQIVWVTGEVTRDLTVVAVEDIDLKIRRSEELIRRHLANGARIVVAVPADNLSEATRALEEVIGEDIDRLTVVAAETVCDVTTALGLKRRRRMRQWLASAPSAITSRSKAPRTLAYAASFSLFAVTLAAGWHQVGPPTDLGVVKAQGVIQAQAVRVLPAALQVKSQPPLIATSVTARAPNGMPCAAVHLDQVTPLKTERVVVDGAPAAAVPVSGLCDFRYRLTNKTLRTSVVWILAQRAGKEGSGFRIRPFHAEQKLTSGASLVLDARPPRALSAPLQQSFTVLSLSADAATGTADIHTLWAEALQAKSSSDVNQILGKAKMYGATLRSITHDFRR